MIIRIWGVRGSSPVPLSPGELQKKINAVINLVKPDDLINDASKQRFLANLPPDIRTTVGGNTACIEVRTAKNRVLLLDMGTGLREFEKHRIHSSEKIDEYHIFLTHFHYDHLHGLPFFSPLYNPQVQVHFYSSLPLAEKFFSQFMAEPYHPVGWDSFTAKIDFHILQEGEQMQIDSASISWIPRVHPGGAIAYKIVDNDRIMIYSTDTQLSEKDFQKTPQNLSFFQGADLIIHDAQYTIDEAIAKYDWGHSSYSHAVGFAREFGIKKLLLFHHDPMNSDTKLEDILQSARLLNSRLKNSTDMEVDIAREGMEIEL
ncbi:MAG: hypothetical protein B0D92_08580 [Spirochaeta sp. LUC14_002_19_P3]|nr:MAG: hypothetical protein B0D92_08580 [Spirochaeta sp. LUC14_002_19_P3]